MKKRAKLIQSEVDQSLYDQFARKAKSQDLSMAQVVRMLAKRYIAEATGGPHLQGAVACASNTESAVG